MNTSRTIPYATLTLALIITVIQVSRMLGGVYEDFVLTNLHIANWEWFYTQPWHMLTSSFMHQHNILHYLGNLVTLGLFGWQIERLLGRSILLVSFEFRRERFCARVCNAVVDAPLVIHLRVNAPVAFLEQAGIEHAFERAIERAISHFDLSLCVRFDLLHDSVPMTFATGERHADMENGWHKRLDGGDGDYAPIVSVTDIIVKGCFCRYKAIAQHDMLDNQRWRCRELNPGPKDSTLGNLRA
jgi:hypothetical protein